MTLTILVLVLGMWSARWGPIHGAARKADPHSRNLAPIDSGIQDRPICGFSLARDGSLPQA